MNPFPRTTRSLGAGLIAVALAAGSSTLPATARPAAPTFKLTIKHLDRSGAPTTGFTDSVVDRTTADPAELTSTDDVTVADLPAGHYLLDSIIRADRGATSELIRPQLDLTADLTITIDARQAKPVRISVPNPAARSSLTGLTVTFISPGGTYWFSGIRSSSATADDLFTAQLGPSVPGLSSAVRSNWADPSGGDLFDNTPYFYSLAWPGLDGIPTGFPKVVKPSDLAAVHPSITAQADGTTATLGYEAVGPDGQPDGGFNYPYSKLPAAPTAYVNTTNLRWQASTYYVRDGQRAIFSSPRTSYRPGQVYQQAIGRAAFGPLIPAVSGAPGTTRSGNTLVLAPLQADQAGNSSWEVTGTGMVTVQRDGVELGRLPYPFYLPQDAQLDVPAGKGKFQVDLATSSTGVMDTSTETKTSWTFQSDTTAGQTQLPLWTARFLPAVDDHNVLRTGATHVLPIAITAAPGAVVGKLKSVVVLTSTDDGKTWQKAPLQTTGTGKYAAAVTVPAGATNVSVKAQVADSLGNTVDESITRAYKISR